MLLLLLCNVPTEVCTAFQCCFVSVRVFYVPYHGHSVAASEEHCFFSASLARQVPPAPTSYAADSQHCLLLVSISSARMHKGACAEATCHM